VPTVTVRTIPHGDALALQRGDTWSIVFYRLGNISGRDKLWFTLKDDKDDADATAWVRIEETVGLEYIDGGVADTPANGSITVTDAAAGDLTVALAAVESAKLDDVGNLFYDVQMYDDPTVTTMVRGRAVVMGDVARVTS
jgi:hypothetical protein